ncbi:hypothetical protein AAVH_37842, partial [Aphelenchoides avenae]
RHKRTPANIQAEITVKTLPVQDFGGYGFVFYAIGRFVHAGSTMIIKRLEGGGLHMKRAISAELC